MNAEIQNLLRLRARDLLSVGEVQCVIGHERGPRGTVRPAFVREPAEAERLVWDQTCHHNLVVYVRDYLASNKAPVRVGLVAKPCDVRALNVLLQEGQVARERVFVIGVACPGLVAPREVPGGGAADPALPVELEVYCQACQERVPLFYDALVGVAVHPEVRGERWAGVDEVEAMTPVERLAFWTQQFERCIRCYACRQACPGCYCEECMAEQVDPGWVSIAHAVPQKMFFHVMRAYHLAGRCAGCHACDRACPVHIPLSLLNDKIARDVQALFGYVAGTDAQARPPLATFRQDEELPL